MAQGTRKHSGFTLIELLVVIGIVGILGAAGMGGYAHFIEQARKKNAADICDQIKVAWTNYHRDIGFWPSEYRIAQSGVKAMDTDMCRVLGKAGLLDVLYIDDDSATGLKRNQSNSAELKYGLLSPLGQKAFKNGKSGSDVTDYRYQFVLDVNEDGIIDSSDGMPSELLQGKKIRGDAAVWCWAEDKSLRKEGETYAQSW